MYPLQTCAFVNFENPKAAGRAMRELQGLTVNGVKLLLRYPDRCVSKNVNKPKQAPTNSDRSNQKPVSKKHQKGKH